MVGPCTYTHMARLSKEQVLKLASTQDIWKVYLRESERGWGSNSWYQFYDSYEEAHASYMEINKNNPTDYKNNPTDYVPDYYIVASAPEKVVLTIK